MSSRLFSRSPRLPHLALRGGLGGEIEAIRQDAESAFSSLEEAAGAMTGVKTADYSAKFGDFVECDPTGGGFTVTVPDPTGQTNRSVVVANLSGSTNTINIVTVGGKNINGNASYALATGWTAVLLTVTSNGTYFASPAA